MKITQEIINKGKSSNGGWNMLQAKALGIDKLYKGWMTDLIGCEVSSNKVQEFLDLKDFHFKKKLDKGKNVKKKIMTKMGLIKFEPVLVPIPYEKQYLHPNWQKMRLYVMERDKFCCVNCKKGDKTLHAHHLKYIKGKYVWEVPHWYIVTLCEDCHSEEHGRDLRAK